MADIYTTQGSLIPQRTPFVVNPNVVNVSSPPAKNTSLVTQASRSKKAVGPAVTDKFESMKKFSSQQITLEDGANPNQSSQQVLISARPTQPVEPLTKLPTDLNRLVVNEEVNKKHFKEAVEKEKAKLHEEMMIARDTINAVLEDYERRVAKAMDEEYVQYEGMYEVFKHKVSTRGEYDVVFEFEKMMSPAQVLIKQSSNRVDAAIEGLLEMERQYKQRVFEVSQMKFAQYIEDLRGLSGQIQAKTQLNLGEYAAWNGKLVEAVTSLTEYFSKETDVPAPTPMNQPDQSVDKEEDTSAVLHGSPRFTEERKPTQLSSVNAQDIVAEYLAKQQLAYALNQQQQVNASSGISFKAAKNVDLSSVPLDRLPQFFEEIQRQLNVSS
jgi:rubrerythrin